MQINVTHRPAFSLAHVELNPGEQVRAEAGAMVGMSTNVDMQTGMTGGLLKGLGRRLFGGESFFQNTFTAQNGPGKVLLAHGLPGDIVTLEVPQAGLNIQSSSYIASTPAVDLQTNVGGFKSFFAGEGLFLLQANASGPNQPIVVGSFGGIQEVEVNGDMVIDTGHLVCWDTTLQYRTTKSASGWIASFLSGEGLVVHFQGQGRVWIQSRNPGEFGRFVGPMLPFR